MLSIVLLAGLGLSEAAPLPPRRLQSFEQTLLVTPKFGEAMRTDMGLRSAVTGAITQALTATDVSVEYREVGTRRMQAATGSQGYALVINYAIDCGEFGMGATNCAGIDTQASGLNPDGPGNPSAVQAAQTVLTAINQAAAASDFVAPGGSVVTAPGSNTPYTFGSPATVVISPPSHTGAGASAGRRL
jgi:hypothetical protein